MASVTFFMMIVRRYLWYSTWANPFPAVCWQFGLLFCRPLCFFPSSCLLNYISSRAQVVGHSKTKITALSTFLIFDFWGVFPSSSFCHTFAVSIFAHFYNTRPNSAYRSNNEGLDLYLTKLTRLLQRLLHAIARHTILFRRGTIVALEITLDYDYPTYKQLNVKVYYKYI